MHCIARTPGDLFINGDVNCDGTPRGYAVVEVDGERLSWYYKPAGGKRDMQMRLYAPGRTNSACVYANVWGYDTAWSAVEWIPASGGQAEAMERTQRTDPYYEEVLATGVRGGRRPIRGICSGSIRAANGAAWCGSPTVSGIPTNRPCPGKYDIRTKP